MDRIAKYKLILSFILNGQFIIAMKLAFINYAKASRGFQNSDGKFKIKGLYSSDYIFCPSFDSKVYDLLPSTNICIYFSRVLIVYFL